MVITTSAAAGNNESRSANVAKNESRRIASRASSFPPSHMASARSSSAAGSVCGAPPCSAEPKERQDEQDYDYQTNEIDQTMHAYLPPWIRDTSRFTSTMPSGSPIGWNSVIVVQFAFSVTISPIVTPVARERWCAA